MTCDSRLSDSFPALHRKYLTPVILQLPLWVSGVRRGGKKKKKKKKPWLEFQTSPNKHAPYWARLAFLWQDGVCVCVCVCRCGLHTHSAGGDRWGPNNATRRTVWGKQTNTVKPSFCWEFSRGRPWRSHGERERNRGGNGGVGLFFAPKLSLNSEPLTAILVFHSGLT